VSEVLVLRALGLGDVLTGVPALRGLRRLFPGHRIVLAAPEELGGWLAWQGLVDEVVPVTGLEDGQPLISRVQGAAVAVNLHGSGPQSHELLRRLSPSVLLAYACAEAGVHDGPRWSDDEHEVDRWIRLVQWAGGRADPADLRLPSPEDRRQHVIVHPGAAAGSRRWPVERWAAVTVALGRGGLPVVVTGTSEEWGLCATVAAAAPGAENACGRLDLTALARMVGTAALVLSGDTGVAHLATAFGTPSVTLFGPVSPRQWGARIDRHLHRALWPGTGLVRPGDPHGSTPDERLLRIQVEDVLEAAATLLAGPGRD
jgi:ADP-heptose:LPS heptosyltransferase